MDVNMLRVRQTDACCMPVGEALLSEADATELSEALKVLADPVRLRLVSLVATAAGEEACACDLASPLGRSQPTISHHLSLLVAAGFLTREKRGKWAWYRIAPARFEQMRTVLSLKNVAG